MDGQYSRPQKTTSAVRQQLHERFAIPIGCPFLLTARMESGTSAMPQTIASSARQRGSFARRASTTTRPRCKELIARDGSQTVTGRRASFDRESLSLLFSGILSQFSASLYVIQRV